MITPRSLRGKLTALILAVSFLVLGFGSILIARERKVSLERELITTADAVAGATGEYLVSSLAFDDREDATSALARLGGIDDVDGASLYDERGILFATYYRDQRAATADPMAGKVDPGAPASRSLHGARVEISLPIWDAGKRFGTIHVRASATRLAARLREMYVAIGTALAGLLVLAVVVGWLLQRIVTRPIADLAAVAGRVAAGEESRPSPAQMGADELGALGRALDRMLARLSANARSLRESAQTVEALFDAAPLAIAGVRPDGTIGTWNVQASRMFGLSEDAVLGRSLGEVIPRELYGALIDKTHERARVIDLEVVAHREKGCEIHWLVSWTPLEPAGGALLLVGDVTERRAAERALAEREGQLHRAQQLELVGRLSGGLAHDFNNLLTVILTSASLIERRGQSDPLVVELARSVVESAERGSLLTRRLLGFSKQPAHEIAALDLSAALAGLQRMITSAIGERIELVMQAAREPVLAEVDASQLEQILLNLVINARDAMGNGGTLTVRTRRSPTGPRGETTATGWVVAEISDTGTGMTPEVLARATEAFYTTKAHGTGLGLSTSADLVRGFGGDLVIASVPRQGTTAAVWLPEAQRAGSSAPRVTTTDERRGRETVLLVEDEPAIRASLRHILEDHGYVVLEAGGGEEALTRWRSAARVDVVVTDVVMRGMTGPQLVKELAKVVPTMPVLYISGYLGEALKGHGLGEETMLLQKPFSPDEFLGRLRELLDGRARAATQVPAV